MLLGYAGKKETIADATGDTGVSSIADLDADDFLSGGFMSMAGIPDEEGGDDGSQAGDTSGEESESDDDDDDNDDGKGIGDLSSWRSTTAYCSVAAVCPRERGGLL